VYILWCFRELGARNRRYSQHFCLTRSAANHLCAPFTPFRGIPPPPQNIICPRRLVSKSNRTCAPPRRHRPRRRRRTTTNNYKLYTALYIYNVHYNIMRIPFDSHTHTHTHTHARAPQNQM